jgi:hypothetical protein
MAIKHEFNAIGQHQGFGDIVEHPEWRTALPSHCETKIKRDGAGNVRGFKTSLVNGGIQQIEGIDYLATYALTAWLGHVRLPLAIGAQYNLEIDQMDICTVLLEVDLEKAIYVHPPQGCARSIQTGSQYYDPQ